MRTRTVNFQKRSKLILEHVQKIISEYDIRLTVRQIFYRLVAAGHIDNTIAEYRKISKLLTDARYAGIVPWESIEDTDRAAYIIPTYPNIEDFISDKLDYYSRDMWIDSPFYVEVWIEKKTLVNLFRKVTHPFGVTLSVGKGFNSASSMYEAVKRFREHENKQGIVLYCGDYDPSGLFMTDDVRDRLQEFGVKVDVRRILLKLEHVQKYSLPRAFEVKAEKNGCVYDKLKADTRAAYFLETNDELFQVETEALDPVILTEELENAIRVYADIDAMNKIIEIQENEKTGMRQKLARTDF